MTTTTGFTKSTHAKQRRSLAKTLSWRFIASLDTFVISYIATGSITIGATIVGAEFFTKIILYYLHERGWAHIRWGLKDAPKT
ncbi:MAG: DUF2061 domain-containing protein [Alphaproteobacteria bacterium]|nr:DUF2061 domain-containing protein [Alphaproteobacteria bacterium]